MELPHLGKHCSDPDCRQLDFLPVKCDSCNMIFCMDHYSYVKHNCPKAFAKNVQVPVCPLCNALVPGKSDELPDIRVSRHIDADCKSDKAVSRRKVYANKCNVKGCKQKELIPVRCDSCTQNFCLRHRHPVDHECSKANARPLGKAGMAAALRNQSQSKSTTSGGPGQRSLFSSVTSGISNAISGRSSKPSFTPAALQGNLSEDAALQMALQASIADGSAGSSRNSSNASAVPPSSQEQEDFLLAKAIAESEKEAQAVGGNGNQRRGNNNNCKIS